jgi:hypothetical protein
LPPWPVPAEDPDCDGWSDAREQHVVTDAAKHCNVTAALNDESDNWPGDFNDDRITNLPDIISFGPTFNKQQGQPGYNSRYDLNISDSVLISDIIILGPFFNKTCSG